MKRSGHSGLVRSVDPVGICSLTVITGDTGEAVRAVGGWMCDRVRAGWRVSAVVPAACDPRPLQILGVTTAAFGSESADSVLATKPAALAAAIDVLSLPNPMRMHVRTLMRNLDIEVTVWGQGEFMSDGRFQDVQHRLSPASRAFKAQAMRAASLPTTVGPAEFFRNCGSWYALDRGIELDCVARRSSFQ